MRAGQGAIGDAVAVDVQVTAEQFAGLQVLGGHDLAAVHARLSSHSNGLRQPVVHADFQVEHDEDRCLQPVREVERQRAEFEALVRVFRDQQHMLGVAMGGIGAGQ